MVGYHLLDEPSTPAAFADAVPLAGLDAWKIYLRLPVPSFSQDELMAEPVLSVHQHVVLGALAEFPSALASVRRSHGLFEDTPLCLMGGSMGGAAAQLVMAESGFAFHAAVLINPVVRLRDTIDGLSEHAYAWTAPSSAIASRLDFVARSRDISDIPLRFITGADDMPDAIVKPVGFAVDSLTALGATVDWKVIPAMAHAVTSPSAVDELAVEWFRRYLF
ncbi:prolyl oligopeptidase family serine peptidase [Actinoplanes sp. NPDC049596]|uniref:alpha/beta hydrolase family protein n=1 Tax=unclassified Actinoplanes TaxID=2626549 RepID=UPI00341A6E0F